VLAVVQWLLMELRQAGLLVVAAMLTLAASGSLNRATRAWLDRLIGERFAIIAYKPGPRSSTTSASPTCRLAQAHRAAWARSSPASWSWARRWWPCRSC